MEILRFALLYLALVLFSVQLCQGNSDEDQKASKSPGISKRDEDLRTYESHHVAVNKEQRKSNLIEGDKMNQLKDKRGHKFEPELTDNYKERLRARQRMREEIEDAVERELEQNEAVDVSLKERQLRAEQARTERMETTETKRGKTSKKDQEVNGNKRKGKTDDVENKKEKATFSDLDRKEIKRENVENKKKSELGSKKVTGKNEKIKTVEKRKERSKQEKRNKSHGAANRSKCLRLYKEKRGKQPAEEGLHMPLKRSQAEKEDQQEKKKRTRFEHEHKKSLQAKKHTARNGHLMDNVERGQSKVTKHGKAHANVRLVEEREEKISRFPWHDVARREKKIRDQVDDQPHVKQEIKWKKAKERLFLPENKGLVQKAKPASKYSRFVKKNVARTNEDMFRPHDRP